MTHTAGFTGFGPDIPLIRAVDAVTGPKPKIRLAPDDFVKAIGELPLIQQPGGHWHYGISTDLLGVIVARAAGKSLPQVLQDRIFGPLGMTDTSFQPPAKKLDRMSVGYMRDADGKLAVHDIPESGFWSTAPVFPSGGGGLVSTADDYMAFARMLLAGGQVGRTRLLARPTVKLMTANHLTPEQIHPLFPTTDFLRGRGFGLGVSVSPAVDTVLGSAGKFGWPGAYTTSWFADPREDLVAIIMSQMWFDTQMELRPTFENLVYQAIDD